MKKISEHLSYKEVVRSNTAIRFGIDNTPDEKQLRNIKNWANKIFEPVRAFVGHPVRVNSVFRCERLNTKLRGSKNSQHIALGCAAAGDIDDTYGNITNKEIFHFIKDNLEFDQLVWEFGTKHNPDWVHVSYSSCHNRKQVLISYKVPYYRNGKKYYKTKYKQW